MVPWRLSHLGTGTRFIVADGVRNLEQEDRAAVMPNRNRSNKPLHVTAIYANHNGYQ